jgi:chloramphenicol-sensitive protein RarD
MPPRSEPGGDGRLALGAGVGCYVIWGLIPLLFQALAAQGVGPWEILANRSLWAVPTALAFVLLARQGGQVLAVFRTPRVLGWLCVSAVLVAANWLTFIWAVNSGRVLETSLGYYINPLLSMAAGAVIFRERIDRVSAVAIGLAAAGVALQAVAMGRLPFVSLALAVTFGGYGIVRKRVAADAQTGLFVECLLLALPALAYLAWLGRAGGLHLGHQVLPTALLVACGPITGVPLVLFAWAARRMPLSAMGFLQFIMPTMAFVLGVEQHEPFTPLIAGSFGLIWAGAAVFAAASWRRARAAARAARGPAQAPAAERLAA